MKKYYIIYNEIKNQILKGKLKAGDKISSVRNAAAIYDVSITTVQNAYFDLCADGYIISKEKSGYYVTDIANKNSFGKLKEKSESVKFDLTGGLADADSFDFRLWQRYIKSALRQNERLLSYSEPKGEYDLREAISVYIKEKRNIIASPDNIIIGAGVSPLVHILCSLINKGKSVSFPDKSFVQGISIFSDYGFKVDTRNKDADIIYVSPSYMTRWGDVMPIKRRLELIEYSSKNNSLVIEDDYENEFMYNVRPTPSLYALGKNNIIYMGSFSAMLIPSIRISFMILNDELLQLYEKKENCFSQTASKTEQIALCNYIRDGHIKSQTKKIRRIYSAKAKKFSECLKKYFPNAKIEIGENTLQVILVTEFYKDTEIFLKYGLKIFIEKYENNQLVLVISSAGIRQDDFDKVCKLLSDAIN